MRALERRHEDREVRRRGAIALATCAVFVIAFCVIGGWLQRRNANPEPEGNYLHRYDYGKTVEYGGITYRQRSDVVAILMMGIDKVSDEEINDPYRNGGQADFLRLVVIDTTNKTITQLQIDRDTMTPITILSVLGDGSRTRNTQICLSHGFGDGKEQSCKLTVDAVSNLLYGIQIDFYVSMSMDGITALNDVVGGVTVTLEDDFSMLDSSMTVGTTLQLQGKQAEYFVRYRREVGEGTNRARMVRQEQYVKALTETLKGWMWEDKERINVLYDAVEPYMITDASRGRLINELWAAKDYQIAESIRPEGEHRVGEDGFMEFHVNETLLQELILKLFYQKVE